MKVYIAAPWAHRIEAAKAQTAFEAAGHVVTSHWIKYHPEGELPAEELCVQAQQDLHDVLEADTFVILNLALSEGKAFELGYWLGFFAGYDTMFRPRTILAGPYTRNIFYHLPEIEQVDTIADVIRLLSS